MNRGHRTPSASADAGSEATSRGSNEMMRNLAGFTGQGYDKGRGKVWQIGWLATQSLLTYHWWCPVRLRVAVLRAFGAKIGKDVLLRHRVRIHWPWKLTVGDSCWVGEGAWLLNLEPITIGKNVCVSQEVLLCTGSHDYRSPTFEFDNGPIVIEDGAWVAARATVLRGVRIGQGSVVGAGALIVKDVQQGHVCRAPRAMRVLP